MYQISDLVPVLNIMSKNKIQNLNISAHPFNTTFLHTLTALESLLLIWIPFRKKWVGILFKFSFYRKRVVHFSIKIDLADLLKAYETDY